MTVLVLVSIVLALTSTTIAIIQSVRVKRIQQRLDEAIRDRNYYEDMIEWQFWASFVRR